MDNTDKTVIVQKTADTIPWFRGFRFGDIIYNAERKIRFGIIIFALFVFTLALIFIINFIESNTAFGFGTKIGAENYEFKINSNSGTYNVAFDDYKGTYQITVNIFNEGSKELVVPMFTVSEVLEKYYAPVYCSEAYELSVPKHTVIDNKMVIQINKVDYKEYTTPAQLDFSVQYVDVQTIPKGKEVVVQTGENTQVTRLIKEKYVNGEYNSESIIKEDTVKPEIPQIIYRGVGGTFKAADGVTYSYSYYIDTLATAYGVDTGFGGGEEFTYTGKKVEKGIIAVDPQVIALGSTVYVTGSYKDFGVCYAEDIGQGIVGNRIDIYLGDDLEKQVGFGKRSMRVYVLDDPK